MAPRNKLIALCVVILSFFFIERAQDSFAGSQSGLTLEISNWEIMYQLFFRWSGIVTSN
jgi:hypothetical protein